MILTIEELSEAFLAYLHDWKKLEAEYARLHSWQWIKQHRNLTARHRLTNEYLRWMRHRGL